MNELPHRFRESSFRRYEPFIARAIEAWPNAIKADPSLFNIAQVTFACRCRDAITSLSNNKWDTTVDMSKFEKSTLVVSERVDGTVLIGSKQGIANFAGMVKTMEITNPVPETTSERIFTLTTKEQKALLMELSSRRLLSPRLFVQGLTDQEVEQYQVEWDVALDKHDDKTYILI